MKLWIIKRSYEKESNFLDKRGFICRNLYGDNFDNNPYDRDYNNITKMEKDLSPDGKRMIRKFIFQNKKMEDKLMKEEHKQQEKWLEHKNRENYVKKQQEFFIGN